MPLFVSRLGFELVCVYVSVINSGVERRGFALECFHLGERLKVRLSRLIDSFGEVEWMKLD